MLYKDGNIKTIIRTVRKFNRDHDQNISVSISHNQVMLKIDKHVETLTLPDMTVETLNDSLLSMAPDSIIVIEPDAEPDVITMESLNTKMDIIGLLTKKNVIRFHE